jgi:hypothetical protein
MLPGRHVPDAIRRGLGLAARGVGEWCDLYRATSADNPITPDNRVLRLPAAFVALADPRAAVSYGTAVWQGIFDAAYARPGDYLVGPEGVFFVASITRLGPVICVRANRTVTLARPDAPAMAGVSRYGGVTPARTTALMTAWPASVLANRRDGGRGALPADAPGLPGGAGGWEVLMPGTPGVLLRPGDLIRDDLGRSAVLSGTELTQLGWRLYARQAGS